MTGPSGLKYHRRMSSEETITVTAAIIVQDGRVLIARRPPSGRHPGSWEFPGGKVEPGEEPRECLARELDEELAITASVGELLAQAHYSYPDLTIDLLAHKCDIVEGAPIDIGCDAHEWVAPEALGEYDLLPPDWALAREIFGVDS